MECLILIKANFQIILSTMHSFYQFESRLKTDKYIINILAAMFFCSNLN